ncbi:MAG TPA: carbamate kinase [Ktedonobacterales bacterium]|nr:carbamate kinase [Ktedonobacterales bacterium]
MTHLAVVAIGGNSLIKDSAHQSVPDQWNAVCETATHIAAMIGQGWNVVVTHGNGPQVGFILLRSELSRSKLHSVPLDSCGADTQGAIGYMIQLALHNEFRRRGINRQAVTLVTQVLVDANDPAMQRPAKPIGPFYSEEQARELQESDGWAMGEDAGRGWRRVVASPRPKTIIEQAAIQAMIDHQFIVVAVGGGGIPVIRDEEGNLRGVEAVIDKDLASSLLASSINADLLLISTAVEKVALNYRKADQRDLDTLSATEAKRYLDEGQFAKGSMGPKVQAALEYLERGGQAALITMPESIERALVGKTGTWILPDGAGLPDYVKKASQSIL